MARPEADNPMDKTLCIRMTRSEKDEIDQWVGARNRSDVLRRMVLGKVREDRDDRVS
jgi:hypothetical protein